MRHLLPALLLCLAALGSGMAQAQPVPLQVSSEVNAILQAGAAEQARDRAAYGTLRNGEVLAAKERQLGNRMSRELSGVVAREAVIDQRRGQAAAAYIAGMAPSFGPAAYAAAAQYQAAAQPALPGNWYAPTSGPAYASPQIRPTSYVAGPAAGRPGQWYENPYAARYGFEPVNYGAPAAALQPQQQPLFTAATGSGITASTAPDVWDPLEPMNRAFFAFNEVVDTFLLRPIAWLYSFTPSVVKGGVRSAFANLKSPAVLMNHTLQGSFGDAATTVGRFAVNSTIGVLGFWDAANDLFDWKGKPADFGQTLHSYGIGEGPFLMLPLLGPANTRDAIGNGIDSLADPLVYILNDNANLALTAGKVLSRREELLVPLDELRAGSVDYYASLRSSSQQQRRGFLRGDAPASAQERKANDDLFNEMK